MPALVLMLGRISTRGHATSRHISPRSLPTYQVHEQVSLTYATDKTLFRRLRRNARSARRWPTRKQTAPMAQMIMKIKMADDTFYNTCHVVSAILSRPQALVAARNSGIFNAQRWMARDRARIEHVGFISSKAVPYALATTDVASSPKAYRQILAITMHEELPRARAGRHAAVIDAIGLLIAKSESLRNAPALRDAIGMSTDIATFRL